MPTPLGATFLYWLAHRGLHWFYREVHVIGRDRIPVTGPVLLIGNHPNDLPDVIAGMVTTKRHVRYVATLSATVLPLVSASYKAMRAIPVIRVRDVRMMRARGVDVSAVNTAAFETVRDAFAAGDVVVIFPEGGVRDTPQIGAPRPGVAKMALFGLDNASKTDLTIVPFGIQYEAPGTLRSDLIIHIGNPIGLADWYGRGGHQSARAAEPALTAALHHALIEVTRNSGSWDRAHARDRLTACMAAITGSAHESLPDAVVRVQRRCAELVSVEPASQEGSGDVELSEARVGQPTRPGWLAAAARIGDAVARAGGVPTSARDSARVLDAAGAANAYAKWPSHGWLVVAAIPAVIGLLLHAPLWFWVRRVAKKLTIVRTDYAAKAILPGLHLIFLGYLVFGAVFALGARAAGWSMWWALALFGVLPSLGDLGLSWRDAVRATQLRARVRGWSAADRAALVADGDRLRAAWNALS